MCPLQDPNIISLGRLKTNIKYSRKVLDIKDSVYQDAMRAFVIVLVRDTGRAISNGGPNSAGSVRIKQCFRR